MSTPDPAKIGAFDELIFKRELNEVYLLLDFISGRPDAHIWNLDVDIPSRDHPDQKETPFSLYRRVSEMRYPPEIENGAAESARDKAYDATVLLYVKDKLNSIAAPARGMTIAYTYIYLGEDEAGRGSGRSGEGQTKASVARDAFPGLIKSAYRLRERRTWISYFGFVSFVLSALLLCWTVYGSVILKRFEDDRQSTLSLEQNVYTQMLADQATGAGQRVNGSVAKICCWDSADKLSAQTRTLCGNWSYFQARYDKVIADAGRYASRSRILTFFFPIASVERPAPPPPGQPQPTGACGLPLLTNSSADASTGAPDAANSIHAIGASSGAMTGGTLASNTVSGGAPVHGASQIEANGTGAAQPTATDSAHSTSAASTAGFSSPPTPAPGANESSEVSVFNQEDVQSIGLVVSVCSTYVLPLIFGLIGTISAFLRDTGNKTLASTLSPRDESLVFVRLLLGAIAGIAVGLFYNPTASAQQVTTGAGVLTLSASGFSFLAGYAADVFFTFLDKLSASVFRLASGEQSAK